MLYKGVKVAEVNLVIYLKEKVGADWKENQKIVFNWIVKNNIHAGVECPIDDMVLIYLDDESIISDVYEKAKKDFEDVMVNLFLEDFVEEGNSIDLTLEEYLKVTK